MTTPPITCPTCKGEGLISMFGSARVCCSNCRGTGQVPAQPIATAGEPKGDTFSNETKEVKTCASQPTSPAETLANAEDQLSKTQEASEAALESEPSDAAKEGLHIRLNQGKATESGRAQFLRMEAGSMSPSPASAEREEIQRYDIDYDSRPFPARLGDYALFSDVEALQERHQLARAQDKARIAGLEAALRNLKFAIDAYRFRDGTDTAVEEATQAAIDALSAELNRNTEK